MFNFVSFRKKKRPTSHDGRTVPQESELTAKSKPTRLMTLIIFRVKEIKKNLIFENS